ncbi:PREDICTED: uncharacterized protein LOC105447963 [Wasmannia auropunctata]|uniref:uncharacterized protein LOC105447963 n=1 Tax=Wasmannia auropunctata TaxID=64793 RepID=UPI0005EFD910|nr:PREDICTED: uncharacterized protein LOC105447963 [Wasmannia auropunctata]
MDDLSSDAVGIDDCGKIEVQWWNELETTLQTKIPIYLKNLLTFTGFDNILSLRSFSEENIKDLEEFGKSDMEHFRDKQKPAQDYYFDYLYSQRIINFVICYS